MVASSIAVVLPAYNEAENIKRAVFSAFNFLKSNFADFEIVIVDDGSTDQTHNNCTFLKQELGDCFKIIRHPKNEGYGAALRSGLFSSQKDLIFYSDADNQFDINELAEFVKYIGEYDLVIGYRMNRKDSRLRKFAAFSYNQLIRFIFGLKVKDIDCSFKLFRRECLANLSIERDNFFADTELLLKAKLKGFRLKEVGVHHLPRSSGSSTVRVSHIFTTISDILYFLKKPKADYGEGN